jgi:peptide-methionine (R)-S-oxide reductase
MACKPIAPPPFPFVTLTKVADYRTGSVGEKCNFFCDSVSNRQMAGLSILSKLPEDGQEGAAFVGRTDAADVSRRAFIFGGAAAVSGIAFWGLRRATVAAAQPLAPDEGPRSVTVVRFSAAGEEIGRTTGPRIVRSDEEWRRRLGADAYWVMRHADTERPFTGALLHEERRGIFQCAGCDLALFSSKTKFDSGTGWPSFWQPIAPENIVESPDGSLMVVRTAVSCRLCDGHLGHVFTDGPEPTGLRYCMNSVALKFAAA